MYPFSPADDKYIVTVPLFDKVKFTYGDNKSFTIIKKNTGKKISSINYGGQKVEGYFISDGELKKGKELIINTR